MSNTCELTAGLGTVRNQWAAQLKPFVGRTFIVSRQHIRLVAEALRRAGVGFEPARMRASLRGLDGGKKRPWIVLDHCDQHLTPRAYIEDLLEEAGLTVVVVNLEEAGLTVVVVN